MKKKYVIINIVPDSGPYFLEKNGHYSSVLNADTFYFDSEEEALLVLEKYLAQKSENNSFWKIPSKKDYLSIMPIFSNKF